MQVLSASAEITLASTKEILSMVQIIRGSEGALVTKPSGKVLGSVIFRNSSSSSYPLIPAQYHKAARASLDARGLLFFFSGNGRAAAFYQGNRILVYRAASWHLQPSEIELGINNLANTFNIDTVALSAVFRIASELSDQGHGALITVGDYSSVLVLSEPPKAGHMQWNEMNVASSEMEAVLGLMRQDGATIIDSSGNVIQGMTVLRPPADAVGVLEVGKGSKHSTAAKISGATKCLSIAVSVDGQITVFGKGEVVFKLMG
jgi:hypothetical protein